MKGMGCVVCSVARAKRVCRLKDHALICPGCCACIRHPACEGCGYWAQALTYAGDKAKAKAKGQRTPHFIARIDPEVDAEVDRALAMAEDGRLEAAERIVSRLLGRHSDLHMVQFAMGVICALQGRYDTALAHFDRAVVIFPLFVEAWFNKATAHLKRLEPGLMIRAYQKVIELGDPADDFVGEARKAIRNFEERIRADQGFSLDRYLELTDSFDEAFAAMQNREWGRALAGFERVAAADPQHTQSHGNMGLCHAFLGRRREALAALDRALEIDPDYEPAAINRLGVLAMQEGERLAADFTSVDYYAERCRSEHRSLTRLDIRDSR